AGSPSIGSSRRSAGPWQLSTRELIDVTDRRVIVWDRDWDDGRGGVAEVSAIDGAPLRTRSITGLARNGGLRMWQAVPGGYLAFWARPVLTREPGDALALAWPAPAGTWTTEHVVLGGAVIFGCDGDGAAVIRLALDAGRETWRAALPAGTRDVAVSSDGALVY